MRKKKCKICKEECAKYLWGLPNLSIIEEDLRAGRIIIGGCLISYPSPHWRCKSCGVDYYPGGYGEWDKESWSDNDQYSEQRKIGEESFRFEKGFEDLHSVIKEMLSQEFKDSIFKSRRNSFFLSKCGYGSSNNIEYRYRNGILMVLEQEVFSKVQTNKLPSEIIILSAIQRKKLHDILLASRKKEYIDPSIIDGTQWNLKSTVRGRKIYIHGSNVFPLENDKLSMILRELKISNQIHDKKV